MKIVVKKLIPIGLLVMFYGINKVYRNFYKKKSVFYEILNKCGIKDARKLVIKIKNRII